jgi:prefoldin subunit 5
MPNLYVPKSVPKQIWLKGPVMAENLINEYKKLKQKIDELEASGEKVTKDIVKLRQLLINVWNKMTPGQQKETACLYIA